MKNRCICIEVIGKDEKLSFCLFSKARLLHGIPTPFSLSGYDTFTSPTTASRQRSTCHAQHKLLVQR
ncbi:hypothetical protein E2C01_005823 [Portunus trituberculatus]|uniref:Uncharacterized protein n=1 Tax=Portunus trituberculatus TaxID=210409 RepID=A0A5B7D059_PORTR|nr:hypothetical protein [Portunus trituberculatus]